MKNLNIKLFVGALMIACAVPTMALELNVQSPQRAKPDLTIYYVNPSYLSGGSTIRVTVRNNGSVKSGSAVLSGQNMARNGGYGEASIPSLEPNHAKDIELKLNKVPKKGDQIKFMADSKHHVSESNENNNVVHHGY
ncbi:MAG: CARDB domain-containing protein [Cellvibrionaceae bacterium]